MGFEGGCGTLELCLKGSPPSLPLRNVRLEPVKERSSNGHIALLLITVTVLFFASTASVFIEVHVEGCGGVGLLLGPS